MKEKKYNEVLLIIFVTSIVVILLLVVRGIYWRKELKKGREETRKLMEEITRKEHAKHIEAGIFDENCSICKGEYK